MIITETWLTSLIPDNVVELNDRTLHRQDRSRDTGKRRGGGLCVYVNENWCEQSRVIDSHCSSDLESLSVLCRPFYLPRELTVVTVTAVYIPPDANVKSSLARLYQTISKLQKSYPDGVHVIAGDFNQACLQSVLPKFTQYVNCATRGNNTLDHVYCNLKHAYRAVPLPHLGLSDHLSLLLLPVYIPLRRATKPCIKTITTWPEGALSQLQDCFSRTEWSLFEHEDLHEYTDTVLSYIKICIDNVTVNKRIRVFSNQKPWMTSEVHKLLKARDWAFRLGDTALYSTARTELKRGIRTAKRAYKEKIENYVSDNDPRRVWQGLQHLTNYQGRKKEVTTTNDALLADELNNYFSRFETNNLSNSFPSVVTDLPALTVQQHEVRQVFKAVNTRKAAGPDGVPGKVLKACCNELSSVFTTIFNLSLAQAIVPSSLKSATIIPIPKKSPSNSLADYRPVALTPLIMKCFERLVLKHVQANLHPSLDNHQFAYRSNRCTDDALSITLHTALSHLEQRNSYVRMLFVDYSSAFNTIIPDILTNKLLTLGLPPSTCSWIKDFLSNRPQTVRIGSHFSSTITLSTGSPQGCVLSPLLYSLYTYDCLPSFSTTSIIKFADDTTVVGLITGGDESAYRQEVQNLSEWCSANNLLLNIAKTKELIIDFRKCDTQHQPLLINGECVERVSSFKFLGIHITDQLSWTTNTTTVVKRAQQRLHFLRILKKNSMNLMVMVSFYKATIESVLSYCISVWFAACSAADKKALQRIIKIAENIIGCPLPSLSDIALSRTLSRAKNITKDNTHPGHYLFQLLPSGRRYRSIQTSTTRFKNSFFPNAIVSLNKGS